MQTRIYQKKCVNGSEKSKDRRDAYSSLDLSIYAIKSPIQLMSQSL
jgi:hypothetical protein